MKHIKAFATQAEVATYEQSQQYIEPYIGASYDSVAAHYNHNTPIYKQFYDYDDETHQYNLYEQVEYITNPSSAYINTELIAFNTARIEAVLKANARKAQMQLFGVYGSTMSIELYCNSQSNSATVFAYSAQDISDGGDWIATGVWSTEKLKFVLDVTYTKANGENSRGLTIYNADGSLNKYISPKTVINSPNNRHSDTKPFYICTCDPNGGASGGVGVGRFAPINIYSFKIIDTYTNTVNRDFIPVKRINDNVYGLWDRANSKFYVSPNGTQFTGGAKMIYDTNDVQYQQVEYIENTSTAYIDTGIYGTMNLDFYIEFLPTELATAWKSGVGSIFGSRSAYNSRAYQLTTYNKVSPYSASTRGHFLCANNYGWNDNKAPTANMLLNQKNIIKKENLIFTRADGSTFTLTSQTFTTAATITIFQCAGAGEPAKIKLYKLQFSKNGNILRDFIPVKRINDNVYGLWDRANSKFYISPNGTQFTGGAKMIFDTNNVQYQQVEYIANPNKGYINTGLYASSNTKVECSVKFTEISRSQAIFGCRTKDASTQNSFVVWGLDSNTFRNDFIGTTNTVSGITVNASTTYNITKQAGTLTVNNNSSATITGTLTNNSTTLYIFNVHQPNPSASQYFTGQLYYFKVYNSNTLMRDFIPVKRVSDSKYGLFDLVNRVFYTAGNNIEFTGA